MSLTLIPDKCTGCLRCELACSHIRTGEYASARSVVRVAPLQAHTSYAPYMCPQCESAWCMVACPVQAITLTPSGVKVVQEADCTGCRLCTIACPFGTMHFDAQTQKAIKCDTCDGAPACVTACPTQALEWHPEKPFDADPLSQFAAERSGLGGTP